MPLIAGGLSRKGKGLASPVQIWKGMKTTRLFLVLALAIAGFGLTACNTMKGVGKDVERAGEKIQDNSRR